MFSIVTLSLLVTGLHRGRAQTLQAPYATPTFVTPSSLKWPSDSTWAALNTSLDGRLSTLRPWEAVCYQNDPLFNETACQTVLAGYGTDTTREDSAAALLWPNWETCGYDNSCVLDLLDPQIVVNGTCGQGSTPSYSAEVLSAEDISMVVQWATQNNVKLTIKNTGHDYSGRSASPYSLQVWTHNMKNITYTADFVPQGSGADPVPAVTISAGDQAMDIYTFAQAQNISLALVGCDTVGIAGGFAQGGGHGVLSPAYGLTADNMLEATIVTIDGTIRTINEAQDSDLFWALRGGGPGTWGIVTSVTLAALPQMTMGVSLLTIVPNQAMNTSELAINFMKIVAPYANTWAASGMTAVFGVGTTAYYFNVYWPSNLASVSMLYPVFDDLIAQSASYNVTSNITAQEAFPSVTALQFEAIGPFFDQTAIYGAENRFASRLVPYYNMTTAESQAAVAEAIWAGHQILNGPLIELEGEGTVGEVPLFILADMPVATRNQSASTGANPGLYEAIWHVIYATPYFPSLNESATYVVQNAIHDSLSPLIDLGFTSAYQNEADAYETNWQEAFFGSKYSQLLSIKQKYDPDNFIMNYQGVGFVSDLESFQCYEQDQSEPYSHGQVPL